MKKIFILFLFIFCAIISFAQIPKYPQVQQSANTDSNILITNAIQPRAGLINGVYADTTAANLRHIRQYPFSQIATTSDGKMWYRNVTADTWIQYSQRFGLEDNDMTTDRRVFMNLNNFRYDSGQIILYGSRDNPSDSAFMVTKGLVPVLRVDNQSGTVYNSALNAGSGTFIANGAAVNVLNNVPLTLGLGAYASSFQQPWNYIRTYPITGSPFNGMVISNDTLGTWSALTDTAKYVPFQVNFRSFADATERPKFAIRQTGAIWSQTYPSGSGGSTDSALVIKNGIISSVPYSTFGGGGGGGTDNTNTGSGNRWLVPSSQAIKTVFSSYGFNWDSTTNANGLTGIIDSTIYSTRAWRQKGDDSVSALVPTLTPGTNVTITGTFPNRIINASGDTTEANILDYGAIPNDGLSDTAAIKAALATGKNVFIPPVGVFLWDGYRATVLKGQRVRGGGLNSIIQFSKDTCDVFYMPNDSSRIDGISFRGKGRGSYPGGETFTFSNSIYISGNANTISNCYFKNVKGSAVTIWAGSTIYNNSVYNCLGDSNTIGIYLVVNAEYGTYYNNSFQHSRTAYSERCSGNNKWDLLNGDYADRGFYLNSPGGCNGDHGSVSNSTFNHCVTAIEIGQTQNEYVFVNIKDYFGNVLIGSLDTARQVVFSASVFSGCTITTTKAKNCQITGGSFGPNNSPAVTISGTTGIEFCNIQNSIYQNTTCGGGASLTNPMTAVGDMIRGGTSGVPTALPIGSSGDILTVSGGIPAWVAPTGGGNVSNTGTPLDNQIPVWTSATVIEGTSGLTYDGTTMAVTGAGTFSTSVRSPLYIGTTGTTDGIIMNATTGNASGANPAFIFKGGNNGATQFMRIDHNGTFGIGTNPSSSFKLFMVSLAATNSTGWALIRNSSSQNIFQGADNGDNKIGNQSVTTSSNWLLNRNWVGPSLTTPTAWLHLAAGTTSAQTAPEKFTSGPLLTTIETGTKEYNNAHYESNNALNRYSNGGYIKDFYADAGNTTTTETDLFTYTTKANTLSADGEKIVAEFTGFFVASATATRVLRIYFAGSQIASTTTITDNSGNNTWKAIVTLIRTSSTTSRASIQFFYNNGVSEVSQSSSPVQTSLTLSGTNILKITGQAGGTGAATNDIVAQIGTIRWYGAANN